MEVDGDDEDRAKGKENKDKDKDGNPAPTPGQAHPPAKRYRLTDTMKAIIWELVVLSVREREKVSFLVSSASVA